MYFGGSMASKDIASERKQARLNQLNQVERAAKDTIFALAETGVLVLTHLGALVSRYV
jgi:hypothetical protein